jgi:Sec-independent protein translocase protein TatA
VIALIIFGGKGIGKKIAGIIKGTGEGVKEFKKALNEDDKENKESKESKESKE